MSGALPAPCLPPLLGCWAISRRTEAGGFPRETQQEKGGGLGRKPLEPSWNPPDWKGPGQRQGEERGGWAGALPLRQDLAKKRGLLSRAAPAWARPPPGHQQGGERGPGQDTSSPRRPVEAPGGASCSWWLRFGALSSGSSGPGGTCWPGQGQPLGPPPFPGAPQAYRSFWPLHPRRLGLRLARPPAGPCQGRQELAEPKAGSDPMPAWQPLPALPLASGGRGSCGSGLPEP